MGLGSGWLLYSPCLGSNYEINSDISGGPTPSIREVMKSALDASIHLSFANDSYEPLKYDEVFYLATLGGAEG